MPDWHRIGTNYVRTDPPIATVYIEFFFSDFVRVVFFRQFVHLTTYLFIATDVKHILSDLLIADDPVVDTQEVLLLAFLLERISRCSTRDPLASSRNGARGVALFYVVVGNREEIHGVLDKFLVLLCSVAQDVPARAVDDADVRI